MMKFIPLAFGAAMLATAASAQTTGNASNSTSSPGATSNSPNSPGTDMVNRNTGTAAASGNDNQAITTTGNNANHPAHGSNSFTKGQAHGRFKNAGFSEVSNLHMDHHGVWRGRGMKNGQSVKVWLDYKGNVGSNG